MMLPSRDGEGVFFIPCAEWYRKRLGQPKGDVMKNGKAQCCEHVEVHEDLLKLVRETMPVEDDLYDLAELFKIFGDSTRIRILFVLFEAEVCVCDIAEALGMSQSAISHQLAILKKSKLIKNRRKGKSIFYSLADEHVRTIISQGMEHITEDHK